MRDSRPIGVFDSGVGGVTVLQELRRQLPKEGLLYLADLARFPYGPRPLAEVRERALTIIEFLGGLDTKLVVVACNSATAAALNVARERFDIPIVGVIAPGAQAGATATRNGRVAVISTQATLDSGEYVHAIREANPGVVVLGRAAPELVEIVESGDADTARADGALQPIVRDTAAWGGDPLVLGCAHYPLPRASLGRVLGRPRWRIIDSAETAAARVRRILTVNRLGNDDGGAEARVETVVTAAPQRFVDTARRLFGDALPAPRVVDVQSPHVSLAVAR